jgi:phytoene dehydrogenase-like protein
VKSIGNGQIVIQRKRQDYLHLERYYLHILIKAQSDGLFNLLSEMNAYKTPIKNLYLTGASTNPGGISVASGYNMPQVVLKDVKGD